MREVATDSSRSEAARVHCIEAVALCSYLSVTSSDSLYDTLNSLRGVWMGIKVNSTSTRIFSSAVAGWALLVCQVKALITLSFSRVILHASGFIEFIRISKFFCRKS